MATGVTWRWSCVITFLTQLQYPFQKNSILCHKKGVFSFQKISESFYVLYGASLIAQLVRIHLQCRRPQLHSWAGKIHWRRDRLPAPVFLGFPCGSADLYETSFCTDISSSWKTLQVCTRYFNKMLCFHLVNNKMQSNLPKKKICSFLWPLQDYEFYSVHLYQSLANDSLWAKFAR